MLIATIILTFASLLVTYQDLKSRSISWFLPPVIFICGLILMWNSLALFEIIKTIGFIVLLIAFLMIYIRLRFKSSKLFEDYFGIGDLLILISVTPFFYFQEYILFFTFTTILALLFSVLVNMIKKTSTIPYAGYFTLIFSVFFHASNFYSFKIESLING